MRKVIGERLARKRDLTGKAVRSPLADRGAAAGRPIRPALPMGRLAAGEAGE
jgi:hypothetical protein